MTNQSADILRQLYTLANESRHPDASWRWEVLLLAEAFLKDQGLWNDDLEEPRD